MEQMESQGYAVAKTQPAVEVSEDGIYTRLGDQLVRYREDLKVLETRLNTALSGNLPEESEIRLAIPGSPLSAMVNDLFSLNTDLEKIISRIEL